MSNNLLDIIERSRVRARDSISESKRKLAEQYFTPAAVAYTMANMFSVKKNTNLACLDPCAGVGNLAAALHHIGEQRSENLNITLVEKDEFLHSESTKNLKSLKDKKIINGDFFEIKSKLGSFHRIIVNPPYAKIKSDTDFANFTKKELGFKESNLYTAFLSFCLRLLSDDGELVAIIPRSFCSGTQFRNFRQQLINRFYLNEIYLYESRKIFMDSGVRQEVIIVKITKTQNKKIKITHEKGNGEICRLSVAANKIIFNNDPSHIIHIPLATGDAELLIKIAKFKNVLADLGLKASTGKIVDFRCEKLIQKTKAPFTTNLIYQDCITFGNPVNYLTEDRTRGRFFSLSQQSSKLLIKKGNYILVRRISFKEAHRRIISTTLLHHEFSESHIGIENHINYIWGLTADPSACLCRALNAYLSTNHVDRYIRRFSGHTQINASDLNSLPIPGIKELELFSELYQHANNADLFDLADKYFFPDTPTNAAYPSA